MRYDNLITQLCCNPDFKLTIDGVEVTDVNKKDFPEDKLLSLLSNVLSDVVSQRWFNPMNYLVGYTNSGRVFTEDSTVTASHKHLFQACAELYELSWFRRLSDPCDAMELKKELNSYVSDPREFVPALYSASNLHLRFNETQFYRCTPTKDNPQGRTFRPYGGRIRNSLHFMLMAGFVDFDGSVVLSDFNTNYHFLNPIRAVSSQSILLSPSFKSGRSEISTFFSPHAVPALNYLDTSKPVVNTFIYNILCSLNVHCDSNFLLDTALFNATGHVLGSGSGDTYLYLGHYLSGSPAISALLPTFADKVSAFGMCKRFGSKLPSGSISSSEGRTVSQAMSMVTSSSVSASVGNAMTEGTVSTKNKQLFQYDVKDGVKVLYSLALTRQAWLTFKINDMTAPSDYLPPVVYCAGVFSVFGNRKHDDELVHRLCPDLQGKLWYGIFAGWGNSALFAMKKGAKYVGNDTNPYTVSYFSDTVRPLLMSNSQHPIPDIRLRDSKEFDEEYEGKVDFMYDSPPYFRFELYAGFEEQIVGITSYVQFLQDFIKPIYHNAFRYLKPGSYCVVQVESDSSFPNQNWVDAICSVGFSYEFTHGGSEGSGSRTKQPLLVFGKPSDCIIDSMV